LCPIPNLDRAIQEVTVIGRNEEVGGGEGERERRRGGAEDLSKVRRFLLPLLGLNTIHHIGGGIKYNV
jgi:hypothetical protein